MNDSHVIRQRDWIDQELQDAGYQYYERRRQLIMAGRLPDERAPLPIHYEYETVYAQAGDIICIEPGSIIQRRLTDYSHWSVKPEVFRETYRRWDLQSWKPEAIHLDLMRYNCRPYYKVVGAWARHLTEPTYLQGLESSEPVLVPPGAWILVGSKGEPWHSTDEEFHKRYIVEAQR